MQSTTIKSETIRLVELYIAKQRNVSINDLIGQVSAKFSIQSQTANDIISVVISAWYKETKIQDRVQIIDKILKDQPIDGFQIEQELKDQIKRVFSFRNTTPISLDEHNVIYQYINQQTAILDGQYAELQRQLVIYFKCESEEMQVVINNGYDANEYHKNVIRTMRSQLYQQFKQYSYKYQCINNIKCLLVNRITDNKPISRSDRKFIYNQTAIYKNDNEQYEQDLEKLLAFNQF